MRVTIGLAMLLAGLGGALAQEASSPLRGPTGFAAPTAPAAPSAPDLPKLHEESQARQIAMDKRMDARTRHAIGSVCVGCSGTVVRPSRAKAAAAVVEEPANEANAFDPAEAPVD
jgi:hypothetical protein